MVAFCHWATTPPEGLSRKRQMNCDLPTDEIDPKSTHLNRAAHTAAGAAGGSAAAAA